MQNSQTFIPTNMLYSMCIQATIHCYFNLKTRLHKRNEITKLTYNHQKRQNVCSVLYVNHLVLFCFAKENSTDSNNHE